MAAYTLEEIKGKLIALDVQISEAEQKQAITHGGVAREQHTQRGDLGAMYRERERLSKEYERLEAREARAGKNLVRCARPL